MRYPKLHADKLKIVIFDWDNTLAETRTPLIYAVNRVLKEYGLPEWKEVKKLRDNNLSFRDNFPRIFGSRADEAYRKSCRPVKHGHKRYRLRCQQKDQERLYGL